MAWSEDLGGPGGASRPEPPPHELLDDGFAPPPCDLLVIGCGNILRGDDAAGPILVRTLFTRGVPDGVRIVDGGTSGMDVAFGMRGAGRVVLVDATISGAEPGTIFRVPGSELEELPPIDGLHTHNFRWDHALAFSQWLLGPERPTDITVFLVEAARTEFGEPLTREVEDALELVADLIERDFYPEEGHGPEHGPTVEISDAGYLHLEADLARTHFPADACVARRRGDTLELMPLISDAHGGLVLRQRNPAGDRTVLIHEVLDFGRVSGRFPAHWDPEQGILAIALTDSEADAGLEAPRTDAGGDGDVAGGVDRGRLRIRTVDSLPAGAQRSGSGATSRLDPLLAGPREAGGRRDPAYRDASPAAGGGPR